MNICLQYKGIFYLVKNSYIAKKKKKSCDYLCFMVEEIQ